MKLPCLTISNFRWVLLAGTFSLQPGCTTNDPYQDVVQGTITYPFYQPTKPIGRDKPEDRFVIRTTAGASEYSVEIPYAADDYDVEVPIADLSGGEGETPVEKDVRNPQVTDRELVANMPRLSELTQEERALMDKAFGAGEKAGPRQAPSYMMGMAKVVKYYKELKHEYALVEINNLLAYYPTSIKLLKMKGTVLIKLGNLELAEKTWLRAADLAPMDPVIKRGLAKLRKRIEFNQRVAMDPTRMGQPASLPQGLETDPSQTPAPTTTFEVR